jgi:uncharacterized delta-60 repeat protein
VNALALQPDGKIVVGGALKSPDATKTVPPFARLNSDGSRDTYADASTISGNGERVVVQADGKVIAVGSFQIGNPSPTSADVVRLNADGTIDSSFAVGDGTLNPNGSIGSLGVHAVAIQANGKVVIGGEFDHFNDTFAESFLQLNPDGTRDSALTANGPGFNNQVSTLLRQPDGKLLIGFFVPGGASFVGDTPRTKLNSLRIGGLGRLNPDGTTDGTFNTPFDNGSAVSSMALQADGKIVLSGGFTLIGPTTNPQFQCTRLNPDGTLDLTFQLSSDPSLAIFAGPIAIQADGKILTSGYYGGFPGVVRLNSDGSRDTSFSAPLPNGSATEIALQPDGRIVIGGLFRIPGGKLERLGRLNADGSFDATFNSGDGPDNTVWALLLQPDGKILISGKFNNYNGTPRSHIARVNPDGSLDPSFIPANPTDTEEREIRVMALQLDGKVVAGRYDSGDTAVPPPNRIFRLNADGSLDTSLPQTGTGVEGMSENVNAIALQPGGNIVIGGEFNIVNGAAHLALARIIGATPTVLANISTRLRVEPGDNALIAGFIITGTGQKKVLLRAIGPSLPFAGHLDDPVLELYSSNGQTIASNDNWNDASNRQEIIDSTIPPTHPLESAILTDLNPGAYTAIMRGVNDTSGIGVVEAYDLDSTAGSKLANISSRGLVQTGDNVMIAGFIITGSATQKVIVRAVGPSLTVPGKLEDPNLELRDQNGGLIDSNDNWIDSANKQAIIDSTVAPTNDLESAIIATLPSSGAQYTAIVRGAVSTTGVAVVDVFALN